MRPMIARLLAAASLCGFPLALHAQAQAYPNKAVRIVAPFPAGGSADVISRIIGEKLSLKWGQPVIVENRAGAAGNIGAEYVFKAEPDGYTLLSSPPPPLIINPNLYRNLPFDPTQFVPVVIMVAIPNVVLVNPKVPVNSIRADCLCQGEPGQAQLRLTGQRHDIAPHRRDVQIDGGRAPDAHPLQRQRARAHRPARRAG